MKQVIMLQGLPVSGKSYCARVLGNKFSDFQIVKSVLTRFKPEEKVVFTKDSIDESIAETRAEKDKSYESMIDILKENLDKEFVPILDATFHKRYRREAVYNFCKDNDLDLLMIQISFDDIEEIKELLDQRKKNPETKDNVLNDLEQYNLMKEQSDMLTDEEIKNGSFSLISIDRNNKTCKFINDKRNNMFQEVFKCLEDQTSRIA